MPSPDSHWRPCTGGPETNPTQKGLLEKTIADAQVQHSSSDPNRAPAQSSKEQCINYMGSVASEIGRLKVKTMMPYLSALFVCLVDNHEDT